MTRRRCIRSLMAIVVLLAIAGGAGAQFELLEKLKKTTPDQRARIQTELITAKLGLDAADEAKIAALNLRYAQKIQPILESDAGVFSLRSQMNAVNEEKEAELKSVLTPAQLETYLAAKAEIKQKFEERISAGP